MVLILPLTLGLTLLVGATAYPTPLPPDRNSPSCMLNGRACPLPKGWETDWSLINSTALMNVDPDGFNPTHRWGLVTLDWQSGFKSWIRPTPAEIYVEAASASKCRQLKAKGWVRYCSIYHNMELSLEWLESERRIMNPAHADWFLRFPNGTILNEMRQVRPGVGPWLRQYFINWSHPEAASYFVAAITNATLVPGVDGTFTDDSPGVPAEHPEVQARLHLSDRSIQQLQRATQAGGQALAESLAKHGRTCWNCIDGVEGPIGGVWGMNTRPPPPDPVQCAAQMRVLCAPERQQRGLFMEYDTGWNETAKKNLHHTQTLAAFLIVRSPLAFVGTSYLLTDSIWNPLFGMDVGVPQGLCQEKSARVFSRVWSKGTVMLDCNLYTAKLPFSLLSASGGD